MQKILTKGLENRYTGLLSNPPPEYESRLSSILSDCLRLKGDNLSKSDKIFDQLYALLQESNKYSWISIFVGMFFKVPYDFESMIECIGCELWKYSDLYMIFSIPYSIEIQSEYIAIYSITKL